MKNERYAAGRRAITHTSQRSTGRCLRTANMQPAANSHPKARVTGIGHHSNPAEIPAIINMPYKQTNTASSQTSRNHGMARLHLTITKLYEVLLSKRIGQVIGRPFTRSSLRVSGEPQLPHHSGGWPDHGWPVHDTLFAICTGPAVGSASPKPPPSSPSRAPSTHPIHICLPAGAADSGRHPAAARLD